MPSLIKKSKKSLTLLLPQPAQTAYVLHEQQLKKIKQLNKKVDTLLTSFEDSLSSRTSFEESAMQDLTTLKEALVPQTSLVPQKNKKPTVLLISPKSCYFQFLIPLRYSMFRGMHTVLLCENTNHKHAKTYLSKMRENKIFDDVLYFDLTLPGLQQIHGNWKSSSVTLDEYVLQGIDKQFRETLYCLDSFDHVVVCADVAEWLLTLYLHLKSKVFYAVEPGRKHFFTEGLHKRLGRADFKEAIALVKKHDSWNFINSQLVIPLFHIDTPTKKMGNRGYPNHRFDFRNEIKLLEPRIKAAVLNSYSSNLSALRLEKKQKKGIVYLPSVSSSWKHSNGNDPLERFGSFLSKKNHTSLAVALSQLAIDYFMNDEIFTYIKLHPTHSMDESNFSEHFPLCMRFPDIPSEFLSWDEAYDENCWHSTITFKNHYTSPDTLQNKVTLHRSGFRQLGFYLHRLYFAFLVLKDYDINTVFSSKYTTIAPFFNKYYPKLRLAASSYESDFPLDGGVTIIDDWEEQREHISPNSCAQVILVLESSEKPVIHGFYTSAFEINKQITRESGVLLNATSETFYILTTIPCSTENMPKKTLPLSGLTLECLRINRGLANNIEV